MKKSDTRSPIFNSDNNRDNPRRWFWLLFLIFLVIGGFYITRSTPSEDNSDNVAPQEQKAIFEKKIFGQSVEGENIEGYEIGRGEETLFFFGAIHGNEQGTAALMNRLVEEIRINPVLLADTKKLIIIPIANPDGYADGDDKLNANGVNLNLNFATTDWKQYGDQGTYAGAEPFSEPESRVIREIVEQYRPAMMIAFHSQGALVSPELDTKASLDLGKWYAAKTGYAYHDEWDDAGTATRWFEEIYGKPAITVELTSHEESDWQINKAALLELIS